MHGLKGGRWGGRTTLWGLLVPGRCAERRHPDGPVGTSTAAAFFQATGLPLLDGGELEKEPATAADHGGPRETRDLSPASPTAGLLASSLPDQPLLRAGGVL